jgi:hypothetical protein
MTFYTALMMVMGDSIVPANAEEYLISSLITISGIVANACIFASIASYASQLSAEAVEHKRQMTSLRRSIKALHLAPRLAQRVVRYYEYIFARHRNFSVQRLLDELPEVFQRRCAMSVHEAKLRRFAPFETADQGLISELATKLQPEVYMPEAFILTAGRVYECAYFIDRGLVQVWITASRRTRNLCSMRQSPAHLDRSPRPPASPAYLALPPRPLTSPAHLAAPRAHPCCIPAARAHPVGTAAALPCCSRASPSRVCAASLRGS